MKKTLYIGMAIGLGIFALTAGSASAAPGDGGTGIVNSFHDLSGAKYAVGAYGDSRDRICIFCHAPHNTATATADVGGNADVNNSSGYRPLWNHDWSTRVGYTAYSNGVGPDLAINGHATDGAATNTGPGAVSYLCLSCHDGSVALNAYPGGANDSFIQQFGRANIGGFGTVDGDTGALDMSNHHPIGFDYVPVGGIAADGSGGLDPEVAGTDKAYPTTGITIGSLLYGGKMECVTCHDVHNSKNDGEMFLWESNDNSVFCLTCHLK